MAIKEHLIELKLWFDPKYWSIEDIERNIRASLNDGKLKGFKGYCFAQ